MTEEEATFQLDHANQILDIVQRAEHSLQQSSRRKRKESHEKKIAAQAEAAEAERKVYNWQLFALQCPRICLKITYEGTEQLFPTYLLLAGKAAKEGRV